MYYHICKHDEEHKQVPPKKEVPFEALNNSEIYKIINQVFGQED